MKLTKALFAAAHAAMPIEARKVTLLAVVRRLHYDASTEALFAAARGIDED